MGQSNMKKSGKSPRILIPRSSLSRRGFLAGMGATLALPYLEYFGGGTALAQQEMGPKRFLGFYVPNGFNMAQFWPQAPGVLNADALAGTSLSSLTPYANQLLLLNGLDNHAGSAQGDGPGDHARGTSTFLTCVHPLKHASQLQIGPSMDQVLARHFDGQTRYASLEIGCEGGGNENACDSGYSCAYSRNIAWRDAQTPLPKETNPRLLFERLFGGFDADASAAERTRRLRRRTSVLDFVLGDAQALKQRLGQSDKHRMDAYMTGIRDIEQRIVAAANEETVCGPNFERPLAVPTDRRAYAQLMLDILVQAMKCDLTRVGTFMFGNGGSNRAHTEIGLAEGHHELSHHQQDEAKLAKIAQIDAWEISILAHLLERLSTTDMGGHSLLDETTVFFSSEVEDGNRHYHYNLPIVLAGRAGGLQTGQYVDVRNADETNNEPVANLFMRILADAGAGVERFGDDGTRAFSLPG
ncbi:MAG: DUF1552 domain-containing protein [Myxococcota bacterium]|nr:DUF1552 domain-containing protein [Myxococcota bacterium]